MATTAAVTRPTRRKLNNFAWEHITYVLHDQASASSVSLVAPTVVVSDDDDEDDAPAESVTTPAPSRQSVLSKSDTTHEERKHVLYCIGYGTNCTGRWVRSSSGKQNPTQVRLHAVGCGSCFAEANRLYHGKGGVTKDVTDKRALEQLDEVAKHKFTSTKTLRKAEVLAENVRHGRKAVMKKGGMQRSILPFTTKLDEVYHHDKAVNSKEMVRMLSRLGLPFEVFNRRAFHRSLEFFSRGTNLYTDDERQRISSGACGDISLKNFYSVTWMRTTGLDIISAENDEKIDKLIGAEPFVILCVDGWKNEAQRKVLNVSLVLPSMGAEVLVDCFDLGHKHENAETASAALVHSLNKMSQTTLSKVCALCSDNTSCVKQALLRVYGMTRYKHCVPLGCFSHRLSLWAGDIYERFKPLVEDLQWLKKVTSKDSAAEAIETTAKDEKAKFTQLLGYCAVRWGSLTAVTHRFMELQGVLTRLLEEKGAHAEAFRQAFGRKDSPDRKRLGYILPRLNKAVKKLHALIAPCSVAIFFMESAKARAAFAVPIVAALGADFDTWQRDITNEEFETAWYEYPTAYFNPKQAVDRGGKEWEPNYPGWEQGEPLFESRKNVVEQLRNKLDMRRGRIKASRVQFTPFVDDIHELAYYFLACCVPLKMLDGKGIPPSSDTAIKAASAINAAKIQDEDEQWYTPPDSSLLGDIPPEEIRDVMHAAKTAANLWSTQSHSVAIYIEEMVQLAKETKAKNGSNVTFVQAQLSKALSIAMCYWEEEYPRAMGYSDVMQRTALRVLSMVANSASVERANSCMKAIQSKGRLRLSHARALQLTKLRFNDPEDLYVRRGQGDLSKRQRQRRSQKSAAEAGAEQSPSAGDTLVIRSGVHEDDEYLSDMDDEALEACYESDEGLEDDEQHPPSKRARASTALDDHEFEALINGALE